MLMFCSRSSGPSATLHVGSRDWCFPECVPQGEVSQAGPGLREPGELRPPTLPGLPVPYLILWLSLD